MYSLISALSFHDIKEGKSLIGNLNISSKIVAALFVLHISLNSLNFLPPDYSLQN